MVSLPPNLPFYLRNRLLGAKTADDIVDKLYPNDTGEGEKIRNRRYLGDFLLLVNETWLKKNPVVSKKLYDKCYTILKDTQDKKKFISILQKALPKLQKVKGLQDVTWKIGDTEIKGSSDGLKAQSQFFHFLLSNKGFKESIAFQENKPINLKNEYPEQTKVLLKALDDFSLPKGLSMSDCEILMALARMYEVDDSIFPLIETSLQDLVAPDNAYYLYFLGSDAKMLDLCDTGLNTIEKNLDIDTTFEIMKELTKKNQKECQEMIDCCLNFAISQIPKYGKTKKSKLIEQLVPYISLIENLFSYDLHKLDKGLLDLIMSKLSETNLKFLNLSKCAFKELPALHTMEGLEGLMLEDCTKLTNITAIKNIKNLNNINLTGCTNLKNIGPILNFKNTLKILGIAECSSLSISHLEVILPKMSFADLRFYCDNSKEMVSLLNRINVKQGLD